MVIGEETSSVAFMAQAYGEVWYWENRYAQDPVAFDWYQKYPFLAPVIHLYIPRSQPILVVGCGNSAFSEGMVDDGYDEIVNIDISKVVIEAMKNKYSSRPQLKYMHMDVRDMSSFSSGSFTAVIDKGTLDSILCGQSSPENSHKMLTEVMRVLKDDGYYILITYGSPAQRVSLLKKFPWSIKLHLLEKASSGGNGSGCNTDLTSPISLHDANDGPPPIPEVSHYGNVHYIYVCIKSTFGAAKTPCQLP